MNNKIKFIMIVCTIFVLSGVYISCQQLGLTKEKNDNSSTLALAALAVSASSTCTTSTSTCKASSCTAFGVLDQLR